MKLFLDDMRIPKDCYSYMKHRIGNNNELYLENWFVVRNHEEFCDFLSENIKDITHISFDHDLIHDHYKTQFFKSEKEYFDYYNSLSKGMETGFQSMLFMLEKYKENNLNLPVIFFHTMNEGAYILLSKYCFLK